MENDEKAEVKDEIEEKAEVKDEIEEKAEVKMPVKTSVKSYQQGIESEKQEMSTYSEGLQADVKKLQDAIRQHSKDMKNAAVEMQEEGIKNMGKKVVKFRKEIEDQIKENKEAVFHMADNVKYFLSEIHRTEKNFGDYSKAFWG